MKVLSLLGPAAGVLVLAACGAAPASPGLPTPPPPAAARVTPPALDDAVTACGSMPVTGGSARAFVREGAVGCDEARRLLARYFAELTPAERARPGGAGPIPLDSWTCGSDPGTPFAATCSTEDNRQIDAQPA
ncbi:MAG TPA: hypothetical protein VFG87_09125 [Amycolatopsis sp.]|jgi:hypothetical protein|nr:hypothetical protein [Amycolatopsis sp.]